MLRQITLFCFLVCVETSVSFAQPCKRPTARKDLDINMVRTVMLNGGDMFWDRNGNANYEVPKGSRRHPIFAGAIWIGAVDAVGNIKVAAQHYHQTGDDFWAGPIDSSGKAMCTPEYDRIWSIKKDNIEAFLKGAGPTKDMAEWPAINPAAKVGLRTLAPFKDVNGDGNYNTSDGDYPLFALKTNGPHNCDEALLGNQALWWVINDVGDVHTESGGEQLGLEIQITAYAFNPPPQYNDLDLRRSTFYRYRIINKSSEALLNNYFGNWVDTDLGNPADDMVGCDVMRGMGYAFNGDSIDEDSQGLGYSAIPKTNRIPPAIGFDILKGPLANAGDTIDNDRDGIVDEPGESICMSSFMKMGKGATVMGTAYLPQDFYNYMRSRWRDGYHIVYGGNGYPGSPGSTTIECDYMYPGDSDPLHYGTKGIDPKQQAWTEASAGNLPGDRKLFLCNGPFTLAPGQITTIHTSVIFAQATSGNNLSSIVALQNASDKIQKLFDNCFAALYSGLSEIAENVAFSIYPNPAFETLHISRTSEQAATLAIYSVQGQLIHSFSISKEMQELDVSKLPRGLFIYSYTPNKGQRSSGKLVLN